MGNLPRGERSKIASRALNWLVGRSMELPTCAFVVIVMRHELEWKSFPVMDCPFESENVSRHVSATSEEVVIHN